MWNLSFLLLPAIISVVSAQVLENDTQTTDDFSNQGSVPPSKASLIFNSNDIVVDPGQSLHLDCGVEGHFRSCFWEKDNNPVLTFQVEDVHGGYLKGLSKPDTTKGNECGIVINSVGTADHGKWTCKVFVFAKTLQGSKTIIVTVKPQQPTLDLNENPLVVEEGEVKDLACIVPAARPAARFSWFIGTEDITANSRTENTPTDDHGTYRGVSKLSFKFQPRYDRQFLKCIVNHQTLQEPEKAEVAVDVRFAPYPISSTQIYGIAPMDSEYEIKFNFTSNPLPEMRWTVNDQEIAVPGETGRYLATIKNIQDNVYMASLRIRDFSSDDIGVMYKLFARNDIGEKNFDITLSTGPAPPDTIGTGTVVAIVIIVIFIFILLFIIGVMRYRQMYCFGPKDKVKNHLKDSGENLKEEHDTESSPRERELQSAKNGKASIFFKNLTSRIKPKRGQKEPRLDKIEEGEGGRGEEKNQEATEGKSNNPSEIVYAELELNRNNDPEAAKERAPESTEYAEIVGTLPDNKTTERKE